MIVVGHVALIQRTKKQDFVIRVLAELKKQNKDVLGLFPGECREADYLDELKLQVRELNLENNVLFLGRRNDIPDLLKLMDVLIIPSSFEGFPLAGLEAAAAGVPVAACDAAGAKEFIEVSRGGVIFSEDDAASCVRAVESCLRQRREIQADGKKFAEGCGLGKYRDAIRQACRLSHFRAAGDK